jgi:hypothetical protein
VIGAAIVVGKVAIGEIEDTKTKLRHYPIEANKTGSSQMRHLLNLLFRHMSIVESSRTF